VVQQFSLWAQYGRGTAGPAAPPKLIMRTAGGGEYALDFDFRNHEHEKKYLKVKSPSDARTV
jgi:hypothetical protein